MKFARLYNTVRYLQPRQILGQLLLRLRPLWEKPDRFFKQETPSFSGCRWEPVEPFLEPDNLQNSATKIQAGSYSFLNRSERIGWPPNWECDKLPKLWQYNLHYFEWLWALDYEQAREVTLDWINRHDLQRGRVGWDPYPISLRLMNWCAFFYGKHRERTVVDTEFSKVLWRSLFLQTEWLVRHLEVHLRGNHLLENSAALAFIGSCFDGRVANQWLEIGSKILDEEISEQILPDGLHFERSPMYHLKMCHLLILLIQCGDGGLHDIVKKPLQQMLNALKAVCHPDGQIALLNDSAFGIYKEPSAILEVGSRLLADSGFPVEQVVEGAWELPDAGYYGFRGDDGTYIICDAGRIGPDYVPGHAHADIFSFELSLKGQRVIVDSGVHDYEISEMRKYCRSTGAHNTVMINEQDQCEMWGAFRIARRGYPRDVKWEPNSDGFSLSAWHDGYKRLPGKPIHERQIVWRENSSIQVTDKITATQQVQISSRLHFHPSCVMQIVTQKQVLVKCPNIELVIEVNGDCTLNREQTWYCSEFGDRVKNECLCIDAVGSDLLFGYKIAIVV